MPPKTKKKFLLVRWTADESVGVVPESDVSNEDSALSPGCFTDVWFGKGKKRQLYDTEILKISGKFRSTCTNYFAFFKHGFLPSRLNVYFMQMTDSNLTEIVTIFYVV